MGVPLYLLYAVTGAIVTAGMSFIIREMFLQCILFCLSGVSVWCAWFVIKNHNDWFLISAKRYSKYELDAPHFFKMEQ